VRHRSLTIVREFQNSAASMGCDHGMWTQAENVYLEGDATGRNYRIQGAVDRRELFCLGVCTPT